MKVSIGIPTYNGADTILVWCLESILKRSGDRQDYELLICDDSGRPEHRAKSRAISDKYGARWFAHDRNRGIAAGWNTLSRAASSSRIILLNDDIIVARGWLAATTYFLDHNPHAGTCGLHFNLISHEDVPAMLLDPDAPAPLRDWTTRALKRVPDQDPNGAPWASMCPPGCCFGFTREKYELVGGFDEGYISFFEESDFGTALTAKGYPSYVLRHPTLGHLWSATFGVAPEIPSHALMESSRARYIQKWGGTIEENPRRLMPNCKQVLTKWISPHGPTESAINHHFFKRDS